MTKEDCSLLSIYVEMVLSEHRRMSGICLVSPVGKDLVYRLAQALFIYILYPKTETYACTCSRKSLDVDLSTKKLNPCF